jgi:cation diffusion facilitator family transporter
LWAHDHHTHGPHRHTRLPFRSNERVHHHDTDQHFGHGQDHSHGLVDPSILRSRAGVHAVGAGLGILAVTAGLQAIVFVASGSVALLADLIHNAGDALTAIPLGFAFIVRNRRAERWAGFAVVAAIFVSACVAAIESLNRLAHPRDLTYLGAVAVAGAIGFVGNELAAHVRLRAGERIDSPALIADGHHARTDGYVSLGVVASATVVAIGYPRADPLIGLAITALILRVSWQAWNTIRRADDHSA